MAEAQRTPVRRTDYRPPSYLVPGVELTFELDAGTTRVTARLNLVPQDGAAGERVRLDGRDLDLVSVRIDGRDLGSDEYERTAEALLLPAQPGPCVVDVVTDVRPAENTALLGLYASGGILLTQCEPEGFRRITYFPDRPDVPTTVRCTLIADAERYPLLLAGGDRVDGGTLPDGRHWGTWFDPHPKPSYLFALVAGDLDWVEGRHRTPSGRDVTIRVHAAPAELDRCGHALAAVAKAMRWDEERYGLEYDLDVYNVVAVPDFTMGAMENKGLNIFNSRFVLVDPTTATDEDFAVVDAVIAHEYFHNWTGNRVTCRDAFQLCLKEGLAVYREEEFSGELVSPAAHRVQDVALLRGNQFAEDGGPRAHPVRPDEYHEISNLFTWTVYKKGSEIVRMLATVLGPDRFRGGLRHYLTTFDGRAATCEDFVAALQQATGEDLSGFLRWYGQAGTPLVTADGRFDPEGRRYTMTFRQTHPPTPGQPAKGLLPIPVVMALFDRDGRALPLRVAGERGLGGFERVVLLEAAETSVTFEDVPHEPVPSLLRGFSAPVRLRTVDEVRWQHFLAEHDDDPFVRWDALQRSGTDLLLRRYRGEDGGPPPDDFLAVLRRILRSSASDPAFAALLLELPTESVLLQELEAVDPVRLVSVRTAVRAGIAGRLRTDLLQTYRRNAGRGPYVYAPADAGRRRLVRTCLAYLGLLDGDGEVADLLQEHYRSADNMADRLAALAPLVGRADGEAAVTDFEHRYRDEPFVVDKWFELHATSPRPGTLARVRELLGHPVFDYTNPNRVAALPMKFCFENWTHFHAADGSGYAFAAEQVHRLDAVNPSVAARLATCFGTWQGLDERRRDLITATLRKIGSSERLSGETTEIITRTLA